MKKANDGKDIVKVIKEMNHKTRVVLPLTYSMTITYRKQGKNY